MEIMNNEFHAVIELGSKKLISRKKFDEYCRDRESKGFDITWSDPKTNKIWVTLPNKNLKPENK